MASWEMRLFAVRQNLVRLEGRWELHGTKTHKARVVPLPDPVVAALRTHRARQAEQRLAAGPAWQPPEAMDVDQQARRRPDFVFTRPAGDPYFRQGFYKRLRALCERAGVPPMATHDLRRAANTLLLASGVDPVVVRQLGGHKSAAMTEPVYDPARLTHGRSGSAAGFELVLSRPRSCRPATRPGR